MILAYEKQQQTLLVFWENMPFNTLEKVKKKFQCVFLYGETLEKQTFLIFVLCTDKYEQTMQRLCRPLFKLANSNSPQSQIGGFMCLAKVILGCENAIHVYMNTFCNFLCQNAPKCRNTIVFPSLIECIESLIIIGGV